MLLVPCLLLALSCELHNNTDTVEKYYSKVNAQSPEDCCTACTADKACAFATHDKQTCYLKNTSTTTPKSKTGVTLLVVKQQPPKPPTPGPSPTPKPSPSPLPPLPGAKYKVELTEHSPQPAISFANAKGNGASPCSNTFNPSYVEVAGENKRGGVIVRTDRCEATKGALSFAPCDVNTGICGDLEPDYQISGKQGNQDPRVIYDKYTEYFYNFNYGRNQYPEDKCGGPGVPGGPGACSVLLSRTKTPMNASSWEHVPGSTISS